MVSQACTREVAAVVSATDAPPPLSARAANKAVQEPFEVAGRVITPQNLYTGLFVIGELSVPLSGFQAHVRYPHVMDRRTAVDRLLDRR